MAREYSSRRPSRARRGASHQFLLGTVTFLLGYLTASFFDVDTLTHWLNSQVLAHQEMKKEEPKAQAQHAAVPPKPKFEFYTLLANEKVPSQPSSNTATNQPATASAQASTANAAAVKTAVQVIKPNQAPQPVATKTTETRPVTAAAIAKGAYSVQVASFKARQDAEHMKGLLILKGFNVNVVPVVHASKGNWFRVVVGPYANRNLAQRAQFTLAKNERLHGMITNG